MRGRWWAQRREEDQLRGCWITAGGNRKDPAGAVALRTEWIPEISWMNGYWQGTWRLREKNKSKRLSKLVPQLEEGCPHPQHLWEGRPMRFCTLMPQNSVSWSGYLLALSWQAWSQATDTSSANPLVGPIKHGVFQNPVGGTNSRCVFDPVPSVPPSRYTPI